MRQYDVVGMTIQRVDGVDKVLGRTRFAGDLSMPGMLYAKALFSDSSSARITHIDVDIARNLEGVAAVVTAGDVPGLGRFGVIAQDQPVLVGRGEEVRFTGDALAVVAAESERVAERALRAIRVEYEELPGVYSIDEALREGARQLHADKPGNICSAAELRIGEPERAFQEADVVVEETYYTPRQEHAYIETEAGLAFVDDQGCVNIHSCLQDPYHFLNDISRALGIPMNKVRVVSPPVGGGFGAKADVTIQHWLALLALKTRRPVKMVQTREESIRLHPKRHPMRIRFKLGASRGGKITAMSASVLSDAGAYTGRSPTVLRINQMALLGPYDIPNIHVEGRAVFTNNPVSGAFRGYGAPQGVLAREAAMNLLAKEIGMDPVELRLKNCLKEGQKPANRFIVLDSPVSLPRVVAKMLDAAGPPPAPSGRQELVGRGVAFDIPIFDIGTFPGIGLTGVGATVEMFQDGSVTVYSTAVEMGQGVATVLSQVVAEVLGLQAQSISLVLADTGAAPKSGPTTASRQTYVSGNAVLTAAGKLRERLLQRASKELEIDARDLTMEGGRVVPVDCSGPGLDLARVAALCYQEGINLREEAWFKANHGALLGHTFTASIADVAVDRLTGKVRVKKLVCSHDTGKAINPLGVAGQLYGGAVQAQGYALSESLLCEGGKVRTPSLAEYMVPTSVDIPEELMPVVVEEPYPTGPFGAKGLGEHVMCTVPPAILNAICDAVGARFNHLPVQPEKVLEALGDCKV